MGRSRGLQFLFVLVLVPASFQFFGANFLDAKVVQYTTLAVCITAILLALPFVFKKNIVFELPVQLISVAVLFSVLTAYLFWKQDLALSLSLTVPMLLWLFFFWLLRIELPVKLIEAIVILYAGCYAVLYFFQFLHPEVLLFGEKQRYNEWYHDRGIFRILFPGGGVFFLAVFISLNKLTTQRSGRWLWLLPVLAGLVIPVMQATRTYIAGVVLIYLVHFLRNQSLVKKLLVLGLAGIMIIGVSRIDLPVFKGLAKAQQATQAEGLQNQRLTTANYFLTELSPNVVTRIFGNGVPALPGKSAYGDFIENLGRNDINLFDVGIIGMYAMFGILAVVGYLWIWIKSFTARLPRDYQYPRYYLWFLLITSLTYDAVYSVNFLIATVFALYVFERVYLTEGVLSANGRQSLTVDNQLTGVNRETMI